MNISVNGYSIEYVLKRNRRSKRIRLSVQNGGEVKVSIPFRMTAEQAEHYVTKFILEKSDWLIKAIEKLKKFPPKKTAKETREEYLKHKKDALHLVTERLKHFNAFYGYTYKKISIRNQKSRWGSCSKKGNLNFNYRIALLPQELSDYIVVHELCHVRELNHSKGFWDLVAKIIPEYKKLRKELHSKHSI